MGKILEFNPSKRSKKKEEEPEKKLIKELGEDLEHFVDSRGENDPAGLMMKLLFSGVNVHERIEEINRNTEDFSQEVFSKRIKSVRPYTNDQLINFLAKSNSTEWHKDPAFYRAIASEILERLKMITREDK